jgi:bifunctional aspartokinase / homoserine dehydrogenase 1
MQVLKFGGSSVANAQNINKVVQIILQKQKQGATAVVLSALGGITDLLLQTANLAGATNPSYKDILATIELRHLDTVRQLIHVNEQSAALSNVKKICNDIEDICKGIFLIGELSNRTKDKVVAFGELLSSYIITEKCKEFISTASWVDSREYIITDDTFSNAIVNFELTNANFAKLQNNTSGLFIFPGFIASNIHGVTTTLGRGGSDYTAAIIASATNASVVEIWTDVSGMMTADPRIVNNYKPIPTISYQEAMELSHFGAKVIYPPTIQPVMQKNIPVWIKNTFAPEEEGTIIKNEEVPSGDAVRGISSINKITLLSLEGSGMLGIPGFSKRLFEALAMQKINVILITQSSSEHAISVAIDAENTQAAKTAVDAAFDFEITTGKLEPLFVEQNLAVVAVVGDKMKSQPGVAGRMFSTLGKNGVNIRAIAQGSSEKNISTVIAATEVAKAVNVLHETFFETSKKQIHLYIAGIGNVGQRLIDQLNMQKEYLNTHLKLDVKVVGIANSTNMVFNPNGINLNNYKEELAQQQKASISDFTQLIITQNLRNSIFVDVSASTDVALVYQQLLKKSISVVACNKIAASSPYNNYLMLKQTANKYNVKFLYETNVGAALPIIQTINDIINSGDEVQSLKAVLSGTLNFVFNEYNGTESFATIVKRAQNEGYTEPDPRLDLNGTDVARKILILARESGFALEMDNIENNSFMPESCLVGSVADFYIALEKEEAHFKKLLSAAQSKNCKLKFVATFKNGKASVGLEHINPAHDFYHLYGKDNIVLFYTNRYATLPLVVKGAGAGADVTASGVFADIIRATN